MTEPGVWQIVGAIVHLFYRVPRYTPATYDIKSRQLMPKRTKNKKPVDLKTTLESTVLLLRQEWRDSFTGTQARRAIRAVEHAQTLVDVPELSMALARVESRIDAYLALPPDQRPSALTTIGATLRDLQDSAMFKSQLERPAVMVATNKPAPNPSRPKRVATLTLGASVTSLPRVGQSLASKLRKLGIESVGDLLKTTPRRHVDYSETLSIRDASGFSHRGEVTIRGRIQELTVFPGPPARSIARIVDTTGSLRIVWFTPWVARHLQLGEEIAVSGEIDRGFAVPSMTGPEWERVGDDQLSTGRLTPIYPLTQGVTQRSIRVMVRAALDATARSTLDHLPESIRISNHLMPLRAALEQVHFPDTEALLDSARRRLAFDELFLLQLGLVRIREQRASLPGIPLSIDPEITRDFLSSLPFQLTPGQANALGEVLVDLQRSRPMMRLLQGDVGSGKTVVAAAAANAVWTNGRQSVLMAPTEILAVQHFNTFSELFPQNGDNRRPRIALLTGSTGRGTRKEVLERVRDGDVDILIGTHALIQKGVDVPELALLIVDEQHRFGVRQRSHMINFEDRPSPHVLSMTATPIPRTLNMILNGDSDVSVIPELPAGRRPIETRRFMPQRRDQSYALVRTEVAAGRQVFVICPLVEASETLDAKAAVSEAERLQNLVFPDLNVDVLHGRMPSREKDRIMAAFRDQKFDILVSTSVIEVGIDVPNATIMLIEGANRFGLAQLHQFRGRVGRGAFQSYCLLIADESSPTAEMRLGMMVASNDGFELAQKDLEIRGPGDFIGTRQSGLPELSAVVRGFDSRMLASARGSAERLLAIDHDLADPEHDRLHQALSDFWKNAAPDVPMS
ncbi:ATP-dependent DNA helicase RecG [soil metagenome]